MTTVCRYADWVTAVTALGLHPIDQGDCVGEATHLASGQIRRPGLIVTVAAHVCVWHAEIVRQGTPGLITLPHTPLTGVHP
jgi:hypothetical protein